MNWRPSICRRHYNSLGRQPENFGSRLKATPGGFQGGPKTVPMQEQNFKDITLGMSLQVTYGDVPARLQAPGQPKPGQIEPGQAQAQFLLPSPSYCRSYFVLQLLSVIYKWYLPAMTGMTGTVLTDGEDRPHVLPKDVHYTKEDIQDNEKEQGENTCMSRVRDSGVRDSGRETEGERQRARAASRRVRHLINQQRESRRRQSDVEADAVEVEVDKGSERFGKAKPELDRLGRSRTENHFPVWFWLSGSNHGSGPDHGSTSPICKIKPTAALLQHSEKAALPSQTKAINDFRAAEATKRASEVSQPAALTAPPPSNKHVCPDDALDDALDDDESGDMERENARVNPKCARRKHKSPEKSPELVDEDGVLVDVDVSITDPGSSWAGKTADIDNFFGAAFEHTGANGKVKKHRKCNICPKKCILVNKATTLRHHAETHFGGKYRKWASEHSFKSMLPGDIKARKENTVQQRINAHLTECKLDE
ncbi:uncharacterized protein HD556DRAFT_1315092 [Suillus plorans]|uniref:Uncharacterized protein n=1 Tax=Suillus plorans TaxID=116603 RepID=A0A9P7A8I6_9AGAM|nr:uncharacterized protein HD556DRAFT_1315092 [Suillus plorans]KAG1784419.1 hypothetical protein HD556DRAFT_1315092 [Suillus plorans]